MLFAVLCCCLSSSKYRNCCGCAQCRQSSRTDWIWLSYKNVSSLHIHLIKSETTNFLSRSAQRCVLLVRQKPKPKSDCGVNVTHQTQTQRQPSTCNPFLYPDQRHSSLDMNKPQRNRQCHKIHFFSQSSVLTILSPWNQFYSDHHTFWKKFNGRFWARISYLIRSTPHNPWLEWRLPVCLTDYKQCWSDRFSRLIVNQGTCKFRTPASMRWLARHRRGNKVMRLTRQCRTGPTGRGDSSLNCEFW